MTRALVLVALVPLALAGCAVRSSQVEPPDLDLPDAFADARVVDAVPDTPWWRTFPESSLHNEVEETLAGSLGLQAAVARIDQADTAIRQARAGWLPSIDGTIGASRQRTFAPPPLGAQTNNGYQISVSASYEVDVWGRVRAGRDAARADRDAVALDARALALSLSANAAESWLTIVFQRARRDLLERQLETQREWTRILQARLVVGTSTALDIEQQRQQTQSLQAELALVDAQERVATLGLRALQGRTDAEPVDAPRALPALPPDPPLGAPLEVLLARPDVAAAMRRAEAADARVTAAVADRLPSLRGSASVSFQSAELSNLFQELFWSVAANLTAPIFDGGRRATELRRTEAALDERLLAWADTMVVALREVEEARTLEAQQLRYLDEIDAQIATAQRTLEVAAGQYRRGVADYLRVLTAITTLQQLEQAHLAAHRQLLSYRIQLHRALGGSWLEAVPDTRVAEAGR